MFVVTTVHPETAIRAGCLVGFTSQCSIDPDLFIVCLSQKNHTYRVAMDARVLVVHGLDSTQRGLAELFGTTTGDEIDKLAQCSWRPGPGGAPILDDCRRRFIGEILDKTPWGNHTVFLLAPAEVSGDSAAPLLLSMVEDLDAGHAA
jgi:flavin reductase (DIM6/NTAB) family NADH-FMN oxidoreductase RutF